MTLPELTAYGMHELDSDTIEKTLSRKSIGVLGISTDAAPLMRPLCFWYNGESALYFVYVLGAESQKATLSDQADVAGFLVYDIETTFNWRSVLLTGTIERVPRDEREAIEADIEIGWRPNVFERASASETTALYRFTITEQTGIQQLTLPPELRTPSSTSGPD
jgi:nitroimidazol reductase NimA-like FMN-containing flavoprotein (pyridoxamine 5'-phosphate oxidase superfamily)